MAVAPLMQMAMDPRTQKTAKSVIKYLLIFGGVGIAILLFVFMGKKFDPIKKIGDWFRGVAGGGILGSVGRSIGSMIGITPSGIDAQKLAGVISPQAVFLGDVVKGEAEKKRDFKRLAKETTRKMDLLAKSVKVAPIIKSRAIIVKSALKKVQRKQVAPIAKVFASAFRRKKTKKSKRKKKKGLFGW